ncbi:MAG: hypothetical protein WD992_02000 [Candidatus Levyibacteriota bacterium]
MLERAVVISALDEAYQNSIKRCHEEVLRLPVGMVIRLGKDISGCDVLLEVVQPLDQEITLMARSLSDKREYALISAEDRQEIIRGDESSTDPDSVFDALSRLGARNEAGLFSHTHWNDQLNPLPSTGDIGLGDLAFWGAFRGTFPNLECRVVTYSSGTIKAFRYLGFFENLQ